MWSGTLLRPRGSITVRDAPCPGRRVAQVAADAKAALEAAQSQSQSQPIGGEASQEDIGAELGVGASSVTADAELDLLKEAGEREIVSPGQLVGHYVPLVAGVCRSKRAMEAHPMLRSSAVLALAKLMIVDEATCEANLPLVFSLLNNRCSATPFVKLVIGDRWRRPCHRRSASRRNCRASWPPLR